ncbi:tetratricopeptide repeat protein [Chloroflexota bacterium]|nr:tetratricopeptide repeat protein [Chloroflexota bacterium]
MTNLLRIHLLGHFEISVSGRGLSAQDWQSQQTQTIGKILFTNRGKVVTGEQLIEILWPNEPVESARRRLHVRISQLRSLLQDNKSLIQTVHGGYLFQPDETCCLDVEQFQAHLAEGARLQEQGQQIEAIGVLEQARELYRGDLLAEDLYADWTYHQREALRETFITLLIELSECYAQQGRYRLAIARTRQALAKDPLRETIYVRLMLYHYYAGERNQSLRVYDQCKQMLIGELGVDPLKSTVDLYNKIQKGNLWKADDGLRYPPPIYEGRLFEVPYALTEIPLVGRDREYAWLVSQWQDPDKHIILLEGEAGIGKSRLVNRFTEYVDKQSIRTLKVQLPSSEHRPTAAIVSALQEMLTESVVNKLHPDTLAALAILIPEIHDRVDGIAELTPLLPNGEQQRLKQAINDLSAACAGLPTLIIVDDAQRLSSTAVDLLTQLSKTFRVLLSYRSEDTPPDHPLRTAFGPAGLTLRSLALKDIQSLITHLSGRQHPVLSKQIHTQSEGVPLFVVALLQHMFETGYLFINSSDEWEVTSAEAPALPVTLRATIAARLNHLNPAQRRVFDFAALIDGEFNFDLLKSVTEQSEENLLTTVDIFLDAGLLIEPRSLDKPDFMISHDYYAEVAYETIPAVRRRSMHHQVAKVMESLYAGQLESHAATLADHYHRAGKAEKTLHYATLASEQALARFASIEALHYIEIALPLINASDIEQIAQLRLRREGIYDLHGMRKEQHEDLLALDALYPDLPTAIQAEIRLRRAAYEWILGNNDATYSNVEVAIKMAQSAGAKEIEARALLLAGRAALDLHQSVDNLQRALQVAREMAFPALEGDIIRCLGNAHYWQSKYHQSFDFFQQALIIHRKVGDLRGELSALNNLGKVTELIGDLSEAVNYYNQAAEICQRIKDRLAEGVILTNLAEVTTNLGRFMEAQSLFQEAIQIRAEIGNDEGVAMAKNYLGNLHRQIGQYDLALADYNEAYAINCRIKHDEQTFDSLAGLSALARDLGDYELAQHYWAQAARLQPDINSHRYINFMINSSLLKTLTGEPEAAAVMGEEALALSADLPWFKGPASNAIGHTYLTQGELEQARQYYQQAITSFEAYQQTHLSPEPLAGLAEIALLEGKPELALAIVQDFLPALKQGELQGPDRLLWIYLVYHQVMAANNDPLAPEIIQTAHQILSRRAETISDAESRQSFMTGVRDHNEIIQIRQDLSKAH